MESCHIIHAVYFYKNTVNADFIIFNFEAMIK